jgi:hypothetical protein
LSNTRASGAFSTGSFITNIGSVTGVFSGESSLGLVSVGSYSNHPVAFYQNNSEQMRLTSTGLGIGTSSPAAKLHVASGAGLNSYFNSTASGIYLQIANNGTNLGYIGDGGTLVNGGTNTDFAIRSQAALKFSVSGNATAVIIDSSGNLGLGVTPSAWISGITSFDIASGGSLFGGSLLETSGVWLAANAFYNSSGNGTYKANGFAPMYNVSGSTGAHRWFNAPTGTAGNTIAFTQAMTLDADGDLGIGTTSPAYKLQVAGTISQVAEFTSSADATAVRIDNTNAAGWGGNLAFYSNGNGAGFVGTIGSLIGSTAQDITLWATAGNGVRFYTNGNNERARIDTSGNFGIGTTSPGGLLQVGVPNTSTGSLRAYSSFVNIDAGYQSSNVSGTAAAPSLIWSGDDNTGIWHPASDTLAISTAGSERARIDSSGNFFVGNTSAANPCVGLFPAGNISTTVASGNCIQFWNQATTGDNGFATFYTEGGGGSLRGSITYNRAGGLVAYNVTSDYRSKDISGPVTNSGALIDSTPVYMGTMKGATQERPMFIAHETPAYAHTGEKDAVDADGNPVYQQMDASALIPVMWAEIQSLRKRLADAGI